MALWLNSTFASFDYFILELCHSLALVGGDILTPLAKIFAVIGEFKTSLILYLGFALFLFTRHKKMGMSMIGGVCWAMFVATLFKFSVQRPRPFIEAEIYKQWWQFVGAAAETTFSFPSGHASTTMGGITAMLICSNKERKWWWGLSYIYVLVMCFTRNYLCVHYPSDVLMGIIVGVIAAILCKLTVIFIYWFLNLFPKFFLSKFILGNDE